MKNEMQKEEVKENSFSLFDEVDPVYANMIKIDHNQEEFHLMFITHIGESANVTSKVIVTPGHMKRMISAMSENLAMYEERFGVYNDQDNKTLTVNEFEEDAKDI